MGKSIPGQRFWSHPRPPIHCPRGMRAAASPTSRAMASSEGRPPASSVNRARARCMRCPCPSTRPGSTARPAEIQHRLAGGQVHVGAPTAEGDPAVPHDERVRHRPAGVQGVDPGIGEEHGPIMGTPSATRQARRRTVRGSMRGARRDNRCGRP